MHAEVVLGTGLRAVDPPAEADEVEVPVRISSFVYFLSSATAYRISWSFRALESPATFW